MKNVIKYPSTPNFINFSRTVKLRAEYVGNDENGDPVYDSNRPKPTLTFQGTVKLHGTNGSVVFSNGDINFQSRDNILGNTVEGYKDNSGFYGNMSKHKVLFSVMFYDLILENNIDHNFNDIVIYGEWAGKGIMKGTGINNLDKAFYIFGVKVKPHDEEQSSYWIKDYSYLKSHENNIYNINDFQTFNIEIDFNNPSSYIEELDKLIDIVEHECPVAKQLGHSGVGEGIVFTTFLDDGIALRFKIKGEKYSKASKEPKIKLEDPLESEKLEFAYVLLPNWRLEQGINEVCNLNNGGYIDMKDTGLYLKWIQNDILKEEEMLIQVSKFGWKDVASYVTRVAKEYYIESFKEQLK